MKNKPGYFFLLFSALICFSKSSAQVSKKAINDFLNDSAVSTGHSGISIFDPATGKYVYNYNAEKNFLPSSNVKLFTLYAGMKYLGDSLVGLRYLKAKDSVTIFASGDPSFLHPDFKDQPVYSFLQHQTNLVFSTQFFFNGLGQGWAWDDYLEDFMAERSEFPMYGNLIHITVSDTGFSVIPKRLLIKMRKSYEGKNTETAWRFFKNWGSNDIFGRSGPGKPDKQTYQLPLATSNFDLTDFLADTLHAPVNQNTNWFVGSAGYNDKSLSVIHSRPVDSLFRPMMYNSDNFFAEQTLLMVSNERLGYMSDDDIIDTLLKKDFTDIPTKPRWVDGSGLSRYNLFSPKDFIYILVKLRTEFGWERIKRILPRGGEGTLTNYYESDPESIHAKTGSMSNNVSLSGYITTKKGKTLLFSVIINNFSGTGKSGRKAIESLIQSVIQTN